MTRFLRISILCLLFAVSAGALADIPDDDPVGLLRERAIPIAGAGDLDPLLDAIGGRRLVLLGEASHGTSEFYTWRAAISRRLIEEKGFRFIAVEGDWASSYRLNRYIQGRAPAGESARAIMQGFSRWPTWMWANEEVADLVEWLRTFNEGRPADEQVGFYGIDLYGQTDSLRKVPALTAQLAPDLADRVAAAYACLAPFADDLGPYARSVARGGESCEGQVRSVVALLRDANALAQADPRGYFNLKQHAMVVKYAERHYRAMAISGPESWNVRADHFFNTTERLLGRYGDGARGIVWAHNTHIGDARATVMAARGQRNIGQIARERLGAGDVFAVGFGTHRGTVMAGRAWGAQAEVMPVPEAMGESFEDIAHRTAIPRFLVLFDDPRNFEPILFPIGHRAIGVVYQPERERFGNYVHSVVPRRYDAFVHLDETRALRPVQ
jgi:erythromycin esterase